MEHRPYPKIASVADPNLHSPGGIWVAMEKLHGAQLVVVLDVLIDLEATFPAAYAALDAEKEEALRGRVDALTRGLLA